MSALAGPDSCAETEDARKKRFLVHLVGGGSIAMFLTARNLWEVKHDLRHHRALLGHYVCKSEFGLEQDVPALIPAGRIQMVLDCDT